jgi:hypothetical protein
MSACEQAINARVLLTGIAGLLPTRRERPRGSRAAERG